MIFLSILMSIECLIQILIVVDPFGKPNACAFLSDVEFCSQRMSMSLEPTRSSPPGCPE